MVEPNTKFKMWSCLWTSLIFKLQNQPVQFRREETSRSSVVAVNRRVLRRSKFSEHRKNWSKTDRRYLEVIFQDRRDLLRGIQERKPEHSCEI